MRRKNDPTALVFSVLALALSAYAIYSLQNLKTPEKGDNFKTDVYKVIDQYVAEKSGQAQKQPAKPVEVSLDDDAVEGDQNAPVVLVEFSDYECPYCGRFFNDTLPKIRENYIDTGKVKHVFRDFPLSFHPNAMPAANAAECVREQGGDEKYFQYHDILYQNQTKLSVENLKEYASQIGGVDQTEFAACVDEERYKDEITADFTDGQSYGVQGTPGFFVNGVPISGAQPYAVFEQAIEAALNE